MNVLSASYIGPTAGNTQVLSIAGSLWTPGGLLAAYKSCALIVSGDLMPEPCWYRAVSCASRASRSSSST
jgi:hypothetical protein